MVAVGDVVLSINRTDTTEMSREMAMCIINNTPRHDALITTRSSPYPSLDRGASKKCQVTSEPLDGRNKNLVETTIIKDGPDCKLDFTCKNDSPGDLIAPGSVFSESFVIVGDRILTINYVNCEYTNVDQTESIIQRARKEVKFLSEAPHSPTVVTGVPVTIPRPATVVAHHAVAVLLHRLRHTTTKLL